MLTHVTAVARVVRAAALALAASLLVGFVAVQAFASQYGTPARTVVLENAADDALSAAISSQESAGLRCSEEPTLTDVVLFQHARGEKVVVLTFARAVEESAARTGFIRRYCV